MDNITDTKFNYSICFSALLLNCALYVICITIYYINTVFSCTFSELPDIFTLATLFFCPSWVLIPPIIACVLIWCHLCRVKTADWREFDIYVWWIQPVFLQRILGNYTLWICHWDNCPFLSALQSHWTRVGVTSELSADKYSFFLARGFLVCIQGPVRHVWSLQYKCR